MKGRTPSRCRAGERGSILVLSLWVIFLLALLALAVGAHVEGRLALARAVEQRTAGILAARTVAQRALVLLAQDTNNWDAMTEPWASSAGDFSNAVCGAGAGSAFYAYDLASGGQGTNFGLSDEQARADLNLARVELLVALLEEAGGLEAEAASRLAAAIQSARTRPVERSPGIGEKTGWRDPGIERGPFPSSEEVRGVAGMTDEAFLRIRDQVTVHGGTRVNLNTAGAVMLRSLARAAGGKGGESLSRKILQFRERGGIFKSYLGSGMIEALGPEARLTESERSRLYAMAPYITMTSDHLRGHVEGAPVNRPGAVRRVDFVWDRKRHRIEFWHED